MHDILPGEIPRWQLLESTIRQVFESYGFEQIRIPILEKTEVFARGIGQATDVVEKEMYSFEDRNGDNLSLRPEGTAGVVRAALQNGLLYGAAVKLWYQGPMFRHERPQKGRMRQFHQAGAEIFGAQGPDVDAELLVMGERLWRNLGLDNIQLQLNSLGTAEERAAYREQLVRFMRQHETQLDDETRDRLERNPLRVLDSKNPDIQALLENAPLLPDFLGTDSRIHFEGVQAVLKRLGVAYEINPRLVRGLDYYCHTVFEWVTDDLGAQGTVCAGGRYDDLISLQGGKPWPATGFAMGLERLVALLEAQNRDVGRPPHVYLVTCGTAAEAAGPALAEQLRDALPDLRLLSNAGGGSFKAQFRRADRSGARFALVLAENELQQGKVGVKPLRDAKDQVSVDPAELAGWLAAHLDFQ